MGDFLVVGVHSDEEIAKNKGPTVMKENERYAVVASCKWVDQVVPNAPYYTTVEMLDKYNCDYCVHGDDITTTADGTDCYKEVKEAGRYKECKRTIGISTTELVGRMLLMTKDHHKRDRSGSMSSDTSENLNTFSKAAHEKHPRTNISHFLPTSRRIVQFSNSKEPKAGDTIVYVGGGFDLFHIGHIELLKKAKESGHFVIVGVHDDVTINSIYGSSYPIMNLHERVLSVLACRYVDEVIIGAPYSITKDVLEKVYKIDLVVRGKMPVMPDVDGRDPYELADKLGLVRIVDHPFSDFSSDEVIRRIVINRKQYEERNKRKQEKAKIEEELLTQQRAKELRIAG